MKLRTKPNKDIIIIFIVITIIGIIGILSSFFISDVSIKVLFILLGTTFILASTLLLIGTLTNYEEVDGLIFTVYRIGKKKEIPINKIKSIHFTGVTVMLIDDTDSIICNINPKKNNLILLLKVLEDSGVEYIENIEK